MTKSRTPPAWRRVFLRELARSGNAAGAARACGLDPSYPYQLRKRNPAFAASWDRALAAARERLAQSVPLPPAGNRRCSEGTAAGGGNETPLSEQAHPCSESRASEHPLPQAGGERKTKRPILRPDEIVWNSRTGHPCIVRVRQHRWTAKAEAIFLAELTATANVKAAARAAGFTPAAVYLRRKQWPAFKAQWDAAVAEGHARIETLLVCAATTTLDPEPPPERAYEAPQMSMDQAIRIWLALNAREHGAHKRRVGRPPRREPDIEEVRQEILRKVAAIKRARLAAG